jgi:NAD+ synthase (glutamine-hydrolysing)
MYLRFTTVRYEKRKRCHISYQPLEIIFDGFFCTLYCLVINWYYSTVIKLTRKSGGCYLFSNLRGCDGQRIMFNGGSCIALNGQTIARTRQFSLEEVVISSQYIYH